MPIDEHSTFRPLFDSLGLVRYVADASENEGFGGGRSWQALGPVPKSWTRYRSAQAIDRAGLEMLRRWRHRIVEARASGKSRHIRLGALEEHQGGIHARRLLFGSEWSGCTVDADHFEAMSRVIQSGGHEVHELCFLEEELIVGCFDQRGTLVGMFKPARMRS